MHFIVLTIIIAILVTTVTWILERCSKSGMQPIPTVAAIRC